MQSNLRDGPNEEPFSSEDVLSLHPRLAGSIFSKKPERVHNIVKSVLPNLAMVEKCNENMLRQSYNKSLEWILDVILTDEEFNKYAEGSSGVCGVVWGSNEIAYRCRTCESDPTCAICVNCFLDGDHEGHDFSMIRTGGGCCDCGDPTAWKVKGFCKKHRGPGTAPPLPENVEKCIRNVLKALFLEWLSRLHLVAFYPHPSSTQRDLMAIRKRNACVSTYIICNSLLKLCNKSESLLFIIASLMSDAQFNMLEALFCSKWDPRKSEFEAISALIHKLFGNPDFKRFFAVFFISHYLEFLQPSSSDSSIEPLSLSLLDTFSVQILTVPALSIFLLERHGLLNVLLRNLAKVLQSSKGRLDAPKNISKQFERIVYDMQYSFSNEVVSRIVAYEKPELVYSFLKILAFMQGMGSQTRRVLNHIEIETDNWNNFWSMDFHISGIFPLLLNACSKVDIQNNETHDPSAASSTPGSKSTEGNKEVVQSFDMNLGTEERTNSEMKDEVNDIVPVRFVKLRNVDLPSALVKILHMSCRVLGAWLTLDSESLLLKKEFPPEKFLTWLRPIFENESETGKYENGLSTSQGLDVAEAFSSFDDSDSFEVENVSASTHSTTVTDNRRRRMPNLNLFHTLLNHAVSHLYPSAFLGQGSAEDSMKEDFEEVRKELEAELCGICLEFQDYQASKWMLDLEVMVYKLNYRRICETSCWPPINYDVSSEPVSFHYPLHRFFSLFLHSAVKIYTDNSANLNSGLDIQHSRLEKAFVENATCDWVIDNSARVLLELLPEKFRSLGFVGCVLEHPLRLQVLCAQIQVGLWKRNGLSMAILNDNYHSVHWCEKSLDVDFFILQFCAVLSPTAYFISTVQDRFGLHEFFSIDIPPPANYEAFMAKEMLEFFIRIVAERVLSGFSIPQLLRRELIHRLAVSDATHSSLLKALPSCLKEFKDLHSVLTDVANYSNPSGMQQGKYSLKRECWKELDMHHLRWSLHELQKVEERYYELFKLSAMTHQLPKWTNPYPVLSGLRHLAISASMHNILFVVFLRFVLNAKSPSKEINSALPEGLLLSALHLLALGIDICNFVKVKSSLHDDNTNCSENGVSMSPASQFPLIQLAKSKKMLSGNAKVFGDEASLLSLLVALMKKYGKHENRVEKEKVKSIVQESGNQEVSQLINQLITHISEIDRDCKAELEIIAPDIFGKGKRVMNDVEAEGKRGRGHAEKTEAEQRKALVRARQAEILAKMKAAQQRFVASITEASDIEEKDKGARKQVMETPKDTEVPALEKEPEKDKAVCVLCRESGSFSSPLCYVSFQQRSKILGIATKPTKRWDELLLISRPLSPRRAARSLSESTSGRIPYTLEAIENTALLEWIQETLQAGVTEQLMGGFVNNEQLMDVLRERLPPGFRITTTHVENIPNQGTRLVLDVSIVVDDAEMERGDNVEQTGGATYPMDREQNMVSNEEEAEEVDEEEDDDDEEEDEEEDDDDDEEEEEENEEEIEDFELMDALAEVEEAIEMEEWETFGNRGIRQLMDASSTEEEMQDQVERNDQLTDATIDQDMVDLFEPVDDDEFYATMMQGMRNNEQDRLATLSRRAYNAHDNRNEDQHGPSSSSSAVASTDAAGSSSICDSVDDEAVLMHSVKTDEQKDLDYVIHKYMYVWNSYKDTYANVERDVYLDEFKRNGLECLAKAMAYDGSIGLHLSGCGHSIHQECFDRYFSFILQRHRNRMLHEGSSLINPQVGEFLCPMCRRLANSLLPLHDTTSNPRGYDSAYTLPFSTKISEKIQKAFSNQPNQCHADQTLHLVEAFSFIENATHNLVSMIKNENDLPFHAILSPALQSFSTSLCRNIHRGYNFEDLPNCENRKTTEIHVWESFFYTVCCAELAMRGSDMHLTSGALENVRSATMQSISSLFLSSPVLRVSALFAPCDESRGSLIPSFLRAAKTASSDNLKSIFIRTRAAQLLFHNLLEGGNSGIFLPSFSSVAKKCQDFIKANEKELEFRLWNCCAEPVITKDPFNILCLMVFCFSAFRFFTEMHFKQLVHLMYVVCIAQGIVLIDKHICESKKSSSYSAAIGELISRTFTNRNLNIQIINSSPPFSPRQFASRNPLLLLRLLTLPFLRRCALLSHLLFNNVKSFSLSPADPIFSDAFNDTNMDNAEGMDIPLNLGSSPPSNADEITDAPGISGLSANQNLQYGSRLSRNSIVVTIPTFPSPLPSSTSTSASPAVASSSNSSLQDSESEEVQEEKMREKLDLGELRVWETEFCIPRLSSILNDPKVHSRMHVWFDHFEEYVSSQPGKKKDLFIPLSPASPFRLLYLPYRFHDLFQRFIRKECERCHLLPEKPALCLFCGAFLCGSLRTREQSGVRKGCCGDYQKHVLSCCAGIGVFLMLRETIVILIRSKRRTPWVPLYLDAYGEEDLNLKRGKPLFLSYPRYSTLASIVGSHGLDYNSTILSNTDLNFFFFRN